MDACKVGARQGDKAVVRREEEGKIVLEVSTKVDNGRREMKTRMRFKWINLIGIRKMKREEKRRLMMKRIGVRREDEDAMMRMEKKKVDKEEENDGILFECSFYPQFSSSSSSSPFFLIFNNSSSPIIFYPSSDVILKNMSSSPSLKRIVEQTKMNKLKREEMIYFQNEQEDEENEKHFYPKGMISLLEKDGDGAESMTRVDSSNLPLYPSSTSTHFSSCLSEEQTLKQRSEIEQILRGKNEDREWSTDTGHRGVNSSGKSTYSTGTSDRFARCVPLHQAPLSNQTESKVIQCNSSKTEMQSLLNQKTLKRSIPKSPRHEKYSKNVTERMIGHSNEYPGNGAFKPLKQCSPSTSSSFPGTTLPRQITFSLILLFFLNPTQQVISTAQSSDEKSQFSSMILLNLNEDKLNRNPINDSKNEPLIRHNLSCRTEEGYKLPLEQFSLETCAKCYFYMPDWAFKQNSKLRNETFLANDTLNLSKTFMTNNMVQKWQECCHDAVECCVSHLSHSVTPSPQAADHWIQPPAANSECPRTWDGWTCWPSDVQKGSTVQKPCPAHIYWKITVPPCRGYVTKKCGANGTSWYKLNGREWSNYTNCARDDIYIRRLRYSIITHLISVSFIIPALVIFNYYRQLSSQPRIRLHKHLFTSLVLYAILSSLLKLNLLLTKEVEEDSLDASSPKNSNSGQDYYCLILSLSLRYFRSTCYLWMFNEAFYLYQLIKRAFHVPPVGPLIALAYGVPLVMTISYIVCRSILTNTVLSSSLDFLSSMASANGTNISASINGSMINESASESTVDDDYCWMLPAKDNWTEWVINGPNLCILLINCTLLIPIVREIYKKAAAMPSSGPSHGNSMRRGDNESVKRANNSISKQGSSKKRSIFNRLGTEDEATLQKKLLHRVNSPGNTSKASLAVSLRAATLLLPLYGLHYLVIVYRPDVDICWLSELYHYLSLTLDGLQGSLVSILFCFGNNEVRALLKRSLFKKRDSNLYMTEVVPNPTARTNSPLVPSADRNFNNSVNSATKI